MDAFLSPQHLCTMPHSSFLQINTNLNTYISMHPSTSPPHLRRSLKEGKKYFNPADMSPLGPGEFAVALDDSDRILVLSKMTPYQRIHALVRCYDRSRSGPDFVPWTQVGCEAWVGGAVLGE